MISAFDQACDLIVGNKRQQAGIGTLGEKTLHAVLKFTFEPVESRHEVKIGSYFADIKNEAGITEIHTQNFNTLRKKLKFFLTDHNVTLVYPIPRRKWLVWLNPETGEASQRRKSPKTGSPCDVFFELYKIKQQLKHPHLNLCLLLIDMVEYRNLDGWSKDKKKGASRYERIPEKLVDTIMINQASDYAMLIPAILPHQFTSADFAKAAKITRRSAQTALNVLTHVEAVSRVGKLGNAYVYERCRA